MSQQHVYEAQVQTEEPGTEPSASVQCQIYLRERERGRDRVRWVGWGLVVVVEAAVCLLQFSDLPPYLWLPLFAHSVNYYRKAVYLGCSPTLLHILWPIIKGDLHYKPWTPSKKATATVSASRLIPQLQHYLSTPSCFVSLSLSFCLHLSLSPYLLLPFAPFLLIPLLQHAYVG